MGFDTERWKLLKICEMNARRACIPGIQKMAGEIFVDPWPQSDSDIWLSMFTEAKAVNIDNHISESDCGQGSTKISPAIF